MPGVNGLRYGKLLRQIVIASGVFSEDKFTTLHRLLSVGQQHALDSFGTGRDMRPVQWMLMLGRLNLSFLF
jgi:hypothetical protein